MRDCSLLLPFSLTLLACGAGLAPGPAHDAAATDAADAADTTDTTDSANRADAMGTDGGSSDAASEGGVNDGGQGMPGLFASCLEGNVTAQTPALVLQQGGTSLRIDTYGHGDVLHRYGPGAAGAAPVQVRDSWVLSHVTVGDAPSFEHRVTLVSPAGTVQWEEVFPVTVPDPTGVIALAPTQLFLGANGVVVFGLYGWDGHEAHANALVRSPDGGRFELLEAAPLGPPDGQGRVPVHGLADGGIPPSYWTPATGVTTALAGPGATATAPFQVGNYFVYFVQQDDGLYLVRNAEGNEARVRLSFVDTVNDLNIPAANPAGWLLLQRTLDRDGPLVHRCDLRTLEVQELQIEAPAGLTRSLYSDHSIDDEGFVLGVFRDSDWARFYRTQDGVGWQALGRPVTGVLATMLGEQTRGRYVIVGTNGRFAGDEWPATVRDEPLGLRGPSVQLALSGDANAVVLPALDSDALEPREVSLSPGGRCAAWIGTVDGETRLSVFEAERAELLQVPMPEPTSAGFATFAWWR